MIARHGETGISLLKQFKFWLKTEEGLAERKILTYFVMYGSMLYEDWTLQNRRIVVLRSRFDSHTVTVEITYLWIKYINIKLQCPVIYFLIM